MIAFIIGMIFGTCLGIIALALVSANRKGNGSIDDCAECRANLCNSCSYVKELESKIRGLQSSNGKLAKWAYSKSFLSAREN